MATDFSGQTTPSSSLPNSTCSVTRARTTGVPTSRPATTSASTASTVHCTASSPCPASPRSLRQAYEVINDFLDEDVVRTQEDPMNRPAWVRLDNASNIFLAARTDADPKVFRLSAEMDHDVDPDSPAGRLDETYEQYPLYHAVLRRGVFWYYLQDSDLRPRDHRRGAAHVRADLPGGPAQPAVPRHAPPQAHQSGGVPCPLRRHRCTVVPLRSGDGLPPAAVSGGPAPAGRERRGPGAPAALMPPPWTANRWAPIRRGN